MTGDDMIGGLCKCPHCHNHHSGVCQRLKAIEYHENGRVKRVEYHDPTPPVAPVPVGPFPLQWPPLTPTCSGIAVTNTPGETFVWS